MLDDNVDLFTQKPSDILDIDEYVICNNLEFLLNLNLVFEIKRRMAKERIVMVEE